MVVVAGESAYSWWRRLERAAQAQQRCATSGGCRGGCVPRLAAGWERRTSTANGTHGGVEHAEQPATEAVAEVNRTAEESERARREEDEGRYGQEGGLEIWAGLASVGAVVENKGGGLGVRAYLKADDTDGADEASCRTGRICGARAVPSHTSPSHALATG